MGILAHRDTENSKLCGICGEVFYRDTRCTWKHWGRAKFCSRACSVIRASNVHREKRGTLEDVYWSYVEKSGPNGCWSWRGYIDPYGYATFSYESKHRKAHRVSATIHLGEIPSDMMVCHTCDNRQCSNPNHLYIGTALENSLDMVRRRRQVGMVLTPEDVSNIRSVPHLPAKMLAEKMGVSLATIYQTRRRKKWKHLP